jgi:hypothetical protein
MITKEKIMKLIEQYLRAISYNLPLSKRKDVVEELRSLMMDEIEQRFGAEPGRMTCGIILMNSARRIRWPPVIAQGGV